METSELRPATAAQTDDQGPRSSRWRGFAYPIAALAIFIGVGVTIRLVWDSQDRYVTTGDEPHYLIAARSLSHFHTLVVTQAYQEEFTRAYYYPPRFPAAPGSLPTRATTAQVVLGPHGYVSIHGLGLPAIIALPSEWFGPTGARLALIIIASGLVLVAWFAGGLFFADRRARFLATVVVCVALPYLTSANQLYPDLPAGLICATAILACTYLTFRGGTVRALRLAWLSSAALVLLPWLHVRFVATGLLLVAALAVFVARTGRAKIRVAVALAIPFTISTLLVLVYNQYAFGDALSVNGGNGTLEVSKTSAMVLVGLHLDRLQGVLVQNPILVFGFVGIFLLWARSRLLAVTVGLTYASLVVLPATEQIWYGGQSLAGRFALAGAVVLLVPTMAALARLREKSALTFRAVCGAVAILETWYVYRVLFDNLDIYNHTAGTPLPAYPSWLPGPALYDSTWAYGFTRNYVALVCLIAVIGALVLWLWPTSNRRSRRHIRLGPHGQIPLP